MQWCGDSGVKSEQDRTKNRSLRDTIEKLIDRRFSTIESLRLTLNDQEERYDLIHDRTEPVRPNQEVRRSIRIAWSIVSKAAERSIRQRAVTFC